MNIMKSLLLTALILSISLRTTKSHAAIGTVAAAPIAVTTGLAIAGGAVSIQAGALVYDVLTRGRGAAQGLALFFSIPFALIGLIMLEGEQAMEFGKLSFDDARKLGITHQELSAYHQELDQLNMLASYVDAEISRDGHSTLEESIEVWSQIKDAVSPLAFNALVKVNKQITEIL